MLIEAGSAWPMGATPIDGGTNFALFSEHAEAVELCVFDHSGKTETMRYFLPQNTHGVWHGYVPGLAAGACYGYRVHGPFDPHSGHRFNANKLLLDPYAKQLKGQFSWHSSHYGFDQQHIDQDLSFDTSDNAEWMPKAVVTSAPSVATVQRPLTPWQETVLYETHVRGFTMRHPDVPESLRGSFAGLSQAQVIDYFKALGITSVELLPVQSFIDEAFLDKRGLGNYWGYNTLSFFAPHQRYMSNGQIIEFRQMVDVFHDAGLEVILDVVYNHTAEGDHLGPTLSFRGIDNASYYRLMPSDHRFYINDTGCGNTFNVAHPRVLQLIVDSLRYWVEVMGVDGFRFDLASILGRDESGFNTRATFFQVVQQDPILSSCKMIAEPWDIGPGGYQLGHFPAGWSEWNDRYRDSVRRFWRGDKGELPELARRLHGSGDVFEHSGRCPSASINFVCSHDGFTLRDLVSYEQRHNQANLEKNRDGHRSNLSQNFGQEGHTDDPNINQRRWQQQRNIVATLIVSQGVPMLLAGDEFGRTQNGNNNAYCQDNETNWLDWSQRDAEQRALLTLVQKMLAIRRHFPVLQADRYRHSPNEQYDHSTQWLSEDGKLMLDQNWHEQNRKLVGYLLTDTSQRRARHLLVLFNCARRAQHFKLPQDIDSDWWLIANTADQFDANVYPHFLAKSSTDLAADSIQIFSSESLPEFNPNSLLPDEGR